MNDPYAPRKDCAFRKRLVKFDYNGQGCQHVDMKGFVCTLGQGEGSVYWMCGLHDDSCFCEAYTKNLYGNDSADGTIKPKNT